MAAPLHAHIRAAHATPFGKLEGASPMSLMSEAAQAALDAAGMERGEIDGLICGYATTLPHLMLSTVFAEHFGIRPEYAHAVQLGGGTGAAMLMLADMLIRTGEAKNVLVVAGENRLTGMTRDAAVQSLAQVGHPKAEAPLGATIPAYYALGAARYMHETNVSQADLAELAVLMRRHASETPGAQLQTPITVEEVLTSKPIASPLKMMDCCPISDGGAAVILSAEPGPGPALRLIGAGQAHTHQHISEAPDDLALGARLASKKALARAGLSIGDMGYLAIYDSFTITLAMLLEALEVCPPGQAGPWAREGRFARDGDLPLNTHGGLLSYGHCGVAGAMAHMAEAWRQMTGRAGDRAIAQAPQFGVYHGDGGVLSSHVCLVMERVS